MKAQALFVTVLFLFVSTIVAQSEKYVSPIKNNVGIYKNEVREVYEKPLKEVDSKDRMLVMQTKRNHYKVQHPDGTVGWIEKRLVAATGKSKTFIFDQAEVLGYLDNPTPVYIIDSDDPNSDPISLDRSFKEALRENVDKETVERQTK
jgi:hypothetical protein